MKFDLKKYTQKLPWATGGLQTNHAEDTLWRDWYAILWVSTLILLGFFCVGAYTFLVTTERGHEDPVVTDAYRSPIDMEVLLETTTLLRERTKKFELLQERPPSAPNPGTLGEVESTVEDTEESTQTEETLPIIPD